MSLYTHRSIFARNNLQTINTKFTTSINFFILGKNMNFNKHWRDLKIAQ